MNSLELQYFFSVVEHGSFTEAAQALSISQPAISKQIRQLETELGCSLFARSGRNLALTEAGQAYYTCFQQFRFQLELLKNRLDEQQKDGRATIQIAYPEDTDPTYFSGRIQDAAATLKYPVRLEFSCYPDHELADTLYDGRSDLILTCALPEYSGTPAVLDPSRLYATQTLSSDSRQAVSAKPFSDKPLTACLFAGLPEVLVYAASRDRAETISDFRSDAFLIPQNDPSAWNRQSLSQAFQRFGFPPKFRFAANLSTILDLTAQDKGVYLSHAWCRAAKSADYRLLLLPSRREFYLAYAGNAAKPEAVHLLERCCSRVAQTA